MSWQGENNLEFDTAQNIENEFVISGITSAPKEMYWLRKKGELPLLPHNAGTPHPTNPHMMTANGAHILMSGSCEFVYSWTEEDNISPEHARNFAHYLDSQFPEAENTVDMNIGASGYIKQFAKVNGSVTDFMPIRPEYTLDTDALLTLHKGSSYMCVLRTAPETDKWDTTYIDAQADSTVTLRPVGSKTYFVFGSVVQKEGKTLERFKGYKCTKPIEIKCPEFTKIVRVHQE
tara:strand:- start:5066 stop:5764 length:699 start_codon:yes stop_codon:yes gene_type:complete